MMGRLQPVSPPLKSRVSTARGCARARLAFSTVQPVAFDDIARDFLGRFEPVDELTVAAAWNGLLANAELPMIRTRPPHRADDYVGFEVRSGGEEGRVLVTLERRVAMISELGDYEGTRLLRCVVAGNSGSGGAGWRDRWSERVDIEARMLLQKRPQ